MKTVWFGRDMRPMRRTWDNVSGDRASRLGGHTSIATDSTISLALKETSGLYFMRRFSFTSLSLTMCRKYQLRTASMMQIRILEVLSQYLLIVTKL